MEAGIRTALTAALAPKYELLERLGEGGMGSVYLAREVLLGRVVAVKVLSPILARDEAFRLRFEHEARAAAGIQHPNVVQVYTVGETGGSPPLPYIIMQYVEGASLETFLAERGPLPERRARRLLRDIAAGLDAAHQRDLIHRDIKPANILIDRASGRAHIADFGISAALSPRALGGAAPLPDPGFVLGTAPYMSPEQTLSEPPGPASDVYSLGIVAYQVLSGRLPYRAKSIEGWMGAHRTQPPAPLRERRAGISDELVRLVERCLAKQPAERPAALELARELVPSSEDEILWPPPGLTQLPRLGRGLRAGAVLLATASAALLLILLSAPAGATTEAGWWRAWGSGPVITRSAGGQAPVGWLVVLWQLALVGAALGVVAGLGWLGSLLARLLPARERLAGLGWRRTTLEDTLADPDGRTGLLLAGSAEFATLSPAERRRIRHFRRLAHRALLFGAAWVVLALGLWAISVALGAPLQPAGGAPASRLQLAFVVLPALLAIGLSLAAQLREHRSSGRSWRRAHSGSFAVPAEVGGEEIAAWYADLPESQEPATPDRPPARAVARLLPVLVVGLVAWTVVALTLLVLATILSGRLARRVGPETAQVAATAEHGDAGRELTASRQALVAYWPPQGSSDSQAVSLAPLLEQESALPPYPLDPTAALGSGTAGLASRRLVADALRRASALPPDTLRILAGLAEHPRTRLLRAAARTRAAALPDDLAGSLALGAALRANAAAAVLAAAQGQLGAAAERLGENAVLADAAVAVWPHPGLLMLHALVLLPLAELERLRGNPAREAELLALARGIDETIARFFPAWLRAGIGLASDPRDLGVLQRLEGDSTVPDALRRAVLQAAGDAGCLNPREWLAGSDPTRQARLTGLPVVPEAFLIRGLRGVAARLRYCAEIGSSQAAR